VIREGREKFVSGRVESPAYENCVPEWEEYPHTPAVFVRVANKGVRVYGKWKSREIVENKERF
jgi:hypothetical protein